MAHPLCSECQHLCRQIDSAFVVRCPLYERQVEDSDLIGQMEDLDKGIDLLRGRVSSLLSQPPTGDAKG